MDMKTPSPLRNMDSPTAPVMNRVALACNTLMTFLSTTGLSLDNHGLIIAGALVGGVGTFVAVLWPNKLA